MNCVPSKNDVYRPLSRNQTASVSQDVEKLESSCTVGGNIKMIQVLWKTIRRVLQKLKIESPYAYDPAIPLLDVC